MLNQTCEQYTFPKSGHICSQGYHKAACRFLKHMLDDKVSNYIISSLFYCIAIVP